MNYYKHHIGDYAAATAHLTWDEDMAYSRLLRVYYQHEKPIPADIDKACRLVRATTKVQRQAVANVLQEFFFLSENGWQQKRADEEIDQAREAGEENNQKKENEKERQRRHRERRKSLFEQLREHGIVPKYDTPTNELEAELSRVTSALPVTPVTEHATAIHKPLANSHKPVTSNHKPIDTSVPNGTSVSKNHTPSLRSGVSARKKISTPLPENFQISDEVRKWAQKHGYDDLDKHLEAFKDKAIAKDYRYADWDSAFKNAIREDWGKIRAKPPPAALQFHRPTLSERNDSVIDQLRNVLQDKTERVINE